MHWDDWTVPCIVARLDDKTAASRNIFARISEVGEESYARGRKRELIGFGILDYRKFRTEGETRGRKYQFVDTLRKKRRERT